MHRFPIIRYISIVDYFLAFKYRGQVFSGPFMQRLLYFDFKETEITKINSFVPEVRNICPKGGTNYFNIRWKLIANEIL
jgi:hypothetical protein